MLYESIYRCKYCSGEDFADPNGVRAFAADTSNQTIPVSHFGDIAKSKIWLVLTNPKGDREDSNVGHLVSSYDVKSRDKLTDANINQIFEHFSAYFQREKIHDFFNPFIKILNGLIVNGEKCSFQNGGICAVDVIKCPTAASWQVVARTEEGKKIWYNCLGHIRDIGPNQYLIKQIHKHNPNVMVFAQSTDILVGLKYKGNSVGKLKGFENLKIYKLQNPKRISIGLGNMRQLYGFISNSDSKIKLHDAMQQAINNYL